MRKTLLVTLLLLPIFVLGFYFIFRGLPGEITSFAEKVSKKVMHRYVSVSVLGTGSMAPTFPKGKSLSQEEKEKEIVAKVYMYAYPDDFSLFQHVFYHGTINRGDLISFTKEDISYLKRVVGMPGDSVELREGLVYINKAAIKEPYTMSPHSTFGGSFIKECTEIQVPENNYIVMGDNRKESDDSRYDLGLIREDEIDAYLPVSEQIGVLDSYWRNTEDDLNNSSKIKLETDKFITLINEYREKNDSSVLLFNNDLVSSSELKAAHIINTGFSESGEAVDEYATLDAMQDAGYWNPITGEIPVQGYFTADELFNNLTTFENTREFLLNKEFEDIGLGIVEGDVKNCPTQVIVVHAGGYIPPNYEKDMIESWEKVIENLRDIQPGWEGLKKNKEIYKDNKELVDSINRIIDLRLENIAGIVTAMNKGLWLTGEQERYFDKDEVLAAEEQRIGEILNNL